MKPWWRTLLAYAPRHWRGLLAIALITLIGVALETLRPWPLKLIVDHALKGRELPRGAAWIGALPGARSSTGLLAWLAVGTVLLFVAAQAVSIALLYRRGVVGGRMSADVGARVLERILRTPPGRLGRSTGDLVKRATSDTACVKELVLSVTLPLVTALLTLAAMFAVMWRLDRGLAILAIAAAVPMAVLIRIFARPMAQRSFEKEELEGQMMTHAEQTLTAIPVVQAFAREEHEERRFRMLSAHTLAAHLRSVFAQLQFKTATGLILALGTAAVMWIGETAHSEAKG